MSRYDDIDPMNIDLETGRPYSNYSTDSLDTSFHDGEMDVDDDEEPDLLGALEEAVNALEQLRRCHGVEVSKLCYPALNMGRAAIAKAKEDRS